jgi:hypothetical protein
MRKAKPKDLKVRMDAATRARIDALAKKRGMKTGALLRSLALEEADREIAAAKARAAFDRLIRDDEGDADDAEPRDAR